MERKKYAIKSVRSRRELERRAVEVAVVLLIFACFALSGYYGAGREYRLPNWLFEAKIEGRCEPSLDFLFCYIS